ncbi:hypothetical protein L7F22_042066 [Adiantum nelumboides]|nr:hypothetical protein [Adiantum nelumboides]
MANIERTQQGGPSRPLSPTSHPLEDPLSLGAVIGEGAGKDDDQDVPSSFQSQGTLRGISTVRAPKSSTNQPRPGYFDLQRLAAQSDMLNNTQSSTSTFNEESKANMTIRGSSKSRAGSIYSVSSHTSESGRKSVSSIHSRRKRRSTTNTNDDTSSINSDADGDDDDDDDELPEWLNRVRHRSPAPMTFQPRPITQVLDFSTHTHSDTASTPSVIDDSGEPNVPPNNASVKNLQEEGDLESQFNKALQETEKWKKAYEELLSRHARELSMVKKAHEAREAALLEILISSGISKSRAERALTHATAQSQVPVFRADERVADTISRTKSPILQQSAPATQTLNSMARSTSSEERELPASIMEAMLDEFHSGISTPVTAPNARSSSQSESRSQSPAPSARSSMSRFMQPNAPTNASATTSTTSPNASNAPSTSSLNSFFTLNWRRKKPSAQIPNGKSQAGSGTIKPTKHVRESSTLSPPTTDATATLTNALDKNRRRSKGREPNVTRLPSLFGQDGTGKDKQSVTQELEPILAHDFRPPTLTMAARRRNGPKPQPFEKVKGGDTKISSSKSSQSDNEYQSSGDEFEVYGGKHLSPEELAQRVASTIQRQREAGAEDTMLTDQYGFVYDATPSDVRLLRRARKEESHAPACLTGIRVGVRARGGTDSQSEDEKVGGDADSDSEVSGSDTKKEEEETVTKPNKSVEAEMLSSLTTSLLPTPDHLKTETSLDVAPSPSTPGFLDIASSKPLVSASSFTAASQASGKNGPTSPEEERLHFLRDAKEEGTNDTEQTVSSGQGTVRRKANASVTVRRLLSQLQEMHSKRQDEQQAEWDAFLNKRKALLQKSGAEKVGGGGGSRDSSMTSKAVDAVRKSGDAFGFASAVNDTTPVSNGEINGTGNSKQTLKRAKGEEEWSLGGLIGLGQLGSNPKDQQEFQKLIQGGIPLIYRPKVWYECSGAFDRVEPGRYQELLDEHENEENACTKQIDLDVGRTMPTNIFFAGDGPGVAKLRRLLVAYSWYNPQCGYCQGMNNLAATLLLTHATEEEAFWVLASLIENILPVDYFTAHLLIAQADQRVLIDFVQELMPKLARHIDELGVDLPAVTFAWFLSLYTDCLPVETLFRVWDVLFVEGMGILFKVALSIFMLNERELMRTNSPSSFYSLMHTMTQHQFSSDKLLAIACEDLRSSVKMDKIEARRAKHIQDLQTELGLDPTEIGQRTPSGSSIQM